MTQPTSTQSDDQSQIDQTGSPGRQLRALREGRKMEVERIAAQLHLSRSVIEALERDQFEDLPSPVFITGYLRNYARLLGADPKPIVDAYNALRPDSDPHLRSATRVQRQPQGNSGGAWGWIIGLLLVVVAAGLAGFWWQSRGAPESEMAALSPESGSSETDSQGLLPNEDGDDAAPSAQEQSAPVDSFGSSVSVPPDAIPLRREATSLRQPPSAPTETEAETTAETTETIPAASLPTEPSPEPEPVAEEAPNREVVLEFSGTSWVDVRDAAGEVVLNGEMREGDRRVITGEPPYKLVIGNAAATRLSVGDKPFDLDRRAQGNVARFSLDPDATE
ncbi:helix-turn-helix domain-containing protein [Thiorhodococcus mannitoliphagus]|uniref:Helix-turn-helix domain-containing protein n=1 Tax=Thiorhodococcus mannitoliphagus TaxID=329406 RepID=A0A6P1DRP0_9GAMM|nr:RodZ domain-containing protein [Thiorhodococcus mannitoliphagus]NEX19591.1 helix-turn-helix domain-containing protein [Thiorhodococcus mannitoliphagus]